MEKDLSGCWQVHFAGNHIGLGHSPGLAPTRFFGFTGLLFRNLKEVTINGCVYIYTRIVDNRVSLL